MQDPNKPDDEFLNDEFGGEFDDLPDFDDLPPDMADEPLADEDFSATDETFDEESFMDADWDEFDAGNNTEQTGGGKTGRSGLSFNAIVIGLAVLVGLGVLAYQVVTTPGPGSGLSRFQSVLDFTGSADGPVLGGRGEQQPADQNDIQAVSEGTSDDGGFLNDPSLLGQNAAPADQGADMDMASLPMPVPISNDMDDQGADQSVGGDDVLTPMPDLAFDEASGEAALVPRGPDALAADVTDDVIAEEEPAPASPALDIIRQAQTQQQTASRQENPVEPEAAMPVDETPDMPVPAADPAPIAEEPAPVAPAPAESVSPAVNEVPDALLAKLDALSDRLGVLEQQLVQMRETGQSDLAGLEEEVAALKSGLRDMPRDPAPVQAESQRKPSPSETAQPKPAKPAAPKKAAARPAASSSAAVPASGPWELRAAQPGRAWVSRQGQREMQSVSVGDTLSGIGRIERIDYTAGRWTVVGTQGQIRQ